MALSIRCAAANARKRHGGFAMRWGQPIFDLKPTCVELVTQRRFRTNAGQGEVIAHLPIAPGAAKLLP